MADKARTTGLPVFSDTQIVQHQLEMFLLNAQEVIPQDRVSEELGRVPQLRSTLRASADLDYILRGMILRLTGWILRDKHKHMVTKTMSISVPINWWEMLKRDHLPKWWNDRWPVVNHTLTKEFTFEEEVRVCPHADVAWQDPQHIRFLEFHNDPPRDKPGVLCPTCGVGQDTDGDGNCAFCGPKYRKLKKE